MTKSNLKLLPAGLVIQFPFKNCLCTKNENGPASTWSVGTNSYTAYSAARNTISGHALSVSANNTGTVIYFLSFPSTGGRSVVAKYSAG